MAGLGTAYKNRVLDKLLNATNFSSPATLYFAVYTAAPTGGSGGTEVTGGSYDRVSITANTTNFPAAASGAAANGTAITFPVDPTADWGTITHWALHDHATNDSIVLWGALSPPQAIIGGNSVSIPVTDLDVTAG